MFGKPAFPVFVLAIWLAAPALAQDAGVSGIPRGPGSAGGLNNSVNDPSGIGNAARIAPPPQPNIAVPAVPSTAPAVSSRISPPASSRVRYYRPTATMSRRELRRASTRSSARGRSSPRNDKFSICRGC